MKWVQRAPHIGAVLVASEKEEKQLLEDYEAEQLKQAEEAKATAEAEAKAAKEAAEVTLKTQGKGK